MHTGLRVRLTYGLAYEEVPATNVIGYIAGLDRQTQGERILVVASYTGQPPRDGTVYAGADENASGVAVMRSGEATSSQAPPFRPGRRTRGRL